MTLPDNLTLWVGAMAAFLTTAGFAPQVIKSIKTRQVRDLSLWQPAVLISGMSAWLIYGIRLNDYSIILANLFSLAFNVILVVIKIRYSK